MGVLDDAECDMADVKLAAGDAVVMVSDGLSDMDVSDHMQDVLKGIRVVTADGWSMIYWAHDRTGGCVASG